MKKTIEEIVAQNLQSARKAKGYDSQRALAIAAKVSSNSIKNIESPSSRAPNIRGRGSLRLDMLEQIARTLGFTEWQLMREDFDPLGQTEKDTSQIEGTVGVAQGAFARAEFEPSEETGQGDAEIASLLSQNLRKLMEARGINQAELARRAGMAVTTVNRVFNSLDKRVSPRLGTLAGIAMGLGVRASDLLKAELVTEFPVAYEPPYTVARQVSRLVEDFLLSAPADRLELLRLASEASSKSSYKQKKQGDT
jgi:transcriptional regulator with XRE-family HTH domain